MQLVRGLDVPVRDRPPAIPVPADAVRVVHVDDLPRPTGCRDDDGMPGEQCPQVVDDGVHVRGELDQHEPPTATHLAPAGGGVGHACRERGIRDGRGPRVECGGVPMGRQLAHEAHGGGRGRVQWKGRRHGKGKANLTFTGGGIRVPPRGTPDPQCGHPVESAITFGRVSPVMPMYAATAALIIE
jgi:hypothetical protein